MTGRCPKPHDIVQALVGNLDADELESIAAHVEDCLECTAFADQVSNKETLPGRWSTAIMQRGFRPEALSDEMAARLKRIANSATTCGPAGGITSRVSEEIKEILAPPQAEGELGRLGEYRVLRLLGVGGMGLVFEAEDQRLKRRVALKVVRRGQAGDLATQTRFRREAQVIAALDHDHIVPVFEVGEADTVSYLTMPLLAGSSLADVVAQRGPLTVIETIEIGQQVCSALMCAHAKQIVHRDLKPQNIWMELREQGRQTDRVRVLDFGLARVCQDTEPTLTDNNAILGTPAYMAPEQIRGQEPDARVDLYGLGVTLYETATGKQPFAAQDTLAILARVATETPLPPHDVRPEIPVELSQLIMQLLSKEAKMRPASAEVVWQSLEQIRKAATSPTPTTSTSNQLVRKRPLWPLAAALLFVSVFFWFAAAPILHYVTNKGRLVLEIDDPQVAVRIVRDQVVVQDWTNQREFILQVGDGVVEVSTTGGPQFTAQRFELKRGRTSIVSVRLEREGKPQLDPNQQMAQMIIDYHGEFEIEDHGLHSFNASQPLPDSIPNLYWIRLEQPSRAGIDAFLKSFSQLSSGPELLHLGGDTLTDEDVLHLAKMPAMKNIGHLSLYGRNLSPRCLGNLSSTRLKFLAMQVTHVDDTWLAEIARIQTLTGIAIPHSQVTDSGLAAIRSMPLESLSLESCTKLTGAGLDALDEMPTLSDLNLHRTLINDQDLPQLRRFPRLSTLWLTESSVTGAGLVHLPALSRLKVLGIEGLGISDSDLEPLTNCKSLKELRVTQNGITEIGLAKLAQALPECEIFSDLRNVKPAE